MHGDEVRFKWRDRAYADRVRESVLAADEFLHRLLLHVLLKGFQRIRHDGLLANRHKAERLAQARTALALHPSEPVVQESVESFALVFREYW